MDRRIASNDFQFLWCELKALFLKKKIINHYKDSQDAEIQKVVSYLKKNRLSVFPYDYTKKYRIEDVSLEKDAENGMFYTLLDGKRLYLKKGYKSKYRAGRYMKNILLEQDVESPHSYLTEDFAPQKDCILIDIGGAEGFFALKHIDKVKHVYIFDCDDSWINAMQETFKPYKDKVTIIRKLVSDRTDEMHIKLDDFYKEQHLEGEKLFVKMDAEGDELNILKGAEEILSQEKDVRLAVCSYHIQDHEEKIRKIFQDAKVTNSPGYMVYYYDFDLKAPYLRRGVLRIEK